MRTLPESRRLGRVELTLAARFAVSVAGLFVLSVGSGCPPTTPSSNDNSSSGNIPFLDQNGNFSFDQATKLPLVHDALTFDGQIDGSGDLDLFKLGVVSPGDHIMIDVTSRSGNLDPVAAVFNSMQELQAFSDDRSADDHNPLIDFIVRGTSDDDFVLGVSPYLGGDTVSSGRYRVKVTINRGEGVPAPRPQAIYLNWRGGNNITIRNVGTFNIPPFDAAKLGGTFAGQTTQVKRRVKQIVEDRYAGFRLAVISSDDQDPPAFDHSTVYFGKNSDQAFAISEDIDSYNANPNDNTIVFSDGFDGAFSHVPSFDEMCLALGNTTAHEVGHLLGLVHTDGCSDLMNSTCGNGRILQPQSFGTSPLDPALFPIGVEAERDLLDWTIGMSGR